MITERVDSPERDDRMSDILLGYLEAVETGNIPDRKQLLASHPEFTVELAEFFAGQDQIECVGGIKSPEVYRPPVNFRVARRRHTGGRAMAYRHGDCAGHSAAPQQSVLISPGGPLP